MSEYNFDGIPDDNEFEGESQSQYDLSGIPDDDDSADVSISLQQKYNSANQNPDQIATAKRHAEKAGIPMLVAQNQPDKAAKLAAAPDWTKLTTDAPVTSRALANDGTLFQIAHDDHEALGGIERGLLTLGKALPVAGPLVQAADTTRSLIEGMTGINIMGDKDDVGTVIQKYGENMDNQARKAGLGLFMAGDSALAHFLAPNAGEGTDGWYYRQNKGEIDAVVDRIATLDASDDPLQKNAALQLAQEYGFDSVPRTIGPGNVVNRRKLLDAVIDKRASAFQANTNAGIIDKNKRRDELVELVRNEDEVLKANAAKVDAYTVPWLVSNSLQFIQQIAQGAAASSVAGPPGAAVAFGAPMFGNEYATGKASGKTDDAAAIDAGASALIESATEMVGLKSIEDAAKGLLPILQGVGRATGTNFSQEQAAAIAGQVYDGFANDKHVEQPDYIKGLDAPEPVKQFLAILDQQLQAGVVGAAGGGGAAVAGAAVKPAADKYKKRKLAAYKAKVASTQRQIDAAKARSSQIIDTIEKIRTSKLKARDTSSLKALIQSIGDAENDAPTAMLLSADAFKQGGIDPDVFKRAVPSAADQVDRAIELGGTIAIDIGELANITDSEVEQGLIPHLKVTEDEWTQYEAESAELWADEAMAEMQEAADEAAKQAEQQDEWTRQRQEIQTAYEDQLNKAGKYDKAANKKMAFLVSSFYTVAASKIAKERPDITPVKLMNEGMMRVTGVKSGEGFNQNTGDNNSVDGEGNIYNQAAETYYQDGPKQPRGAFDPNTLNIHLLEKADLSTFLHETGHFFLEMYSRYADQSAEIGKDIDAVLRQFGIEGDDPASRLAKWRSMPVNEQRQFHEQFAESFEQYLFTGKAPSIELQPIFSTYRRWLNSVYKSLARFVAGHSGAKLNPELAGVFDRMLATDEQIDAAQQARDSRPLFANADQAGMTQAQWDAYMQDQVRSVEQAADTLVARSLRDMKWLTNAKNKQLRKLQREAQALRARVQMEARRAILSRPEYRAWLALKRPVEKLEKAKRKNSKELDASVDNLLAAIAKLGGLDMEEVVSSWGSDPADFNKKSGVFGKPVLRKKGGLSIETIAEKLLEEGYLTPDQHGKVDLAEFEEKLDRAARGEPMYSMFADYDLLLYGDEKRSASPRKEDIDYIGGRLNRGDLLEMYGRNNPEVKWHKPIAGMLLQPAYHGSPYRFDKFSLDHMGKGEGAQAYGWGLYFAGRKEVAEFYRQALSGAEGEIVKLNGTELSSRNPLTSRFLAAARGKNPIKNATALAEESAAYVENSVVSGKFGSDLLKAHIYRTTDGVPSRDLNAVISEMSSEEVSAEISEREQMPDGKTYNNHKEIYDASVGGVASIEKAPYQGQLYKVEIPEDSEMLLWDKPLSEQPQAVKDALGKQLAVRISDTATGADIYSRMAGHFGGAATDGAKERASKRLHSLGINGIKYLDGSSRGKGEGNYNYVIFDDNAIEIIETFYQNKDNQEDGQDKGAVRNLEDMGMVSDDGLHPDVVAELFGLSSGDELVRKLLEIDDPFTAVDKLTDKIMMERHSEFTDQKELERMAEAAIHNEARVRFVATELAMLNKAEGGQKDLKRIIDAARLYAQDLLAGQRIQDIRPSKHAADAARAGKESAREFAKGNLAATIMAKRNQVLHTELVRQAHAAKDEVDKGLKYFARIEKAVNNGVLDADYAQQIIGLLQQHDLRKSVSLIDLERRESLAAWVQAQQDAGFEPMIPENLLMEAAKTHYKRMTLDEFRELVDAIKNIDHLGRLKYKLVQNARKRELAAAAAEIGEAIADNATGEVQTRLEKNSVKDRIFDLANGFLYMHRKFASLIRQMDGWKDGGVLWDYFVKTMNDAGDREAVMREQATMAMADLMKPLHESGGFGMMPKKLFITQIGTSLTREGRLMVALNWGNEGNRQRLMDGEGWDVNQVNAVLATLNAEDWKFVQGVWDHLETYRPMVGEQQKRLSGVEPKWIEASPFMVAGKDGQTYELRGGYLPVKYDADRSTKSLTQDALSNIMDQHKAVRAKTRDSFTKGRAAKVVNRPLRKDFGVIFQHMTEVTHRLAWQDWLMDSKRLLAQPAVDEAVRKHYGPAMVTELQKTLDDIAIGEVGPANEFEAAINHLRTGATVAGLGLNFMTSLMQPLGLTQSMVRIGPTWVMKGLAKWGRMEDALLWIYERSDLMRLRGKTASRELNEELNKIRSPKRAAFNELMFVLIQKAQIIADVLTWLGAYEKAIAEQGPNIDEKLAAKLADQAVLDAQSGGMQKDLARIQRGGSLQRLFTMFYSYFSSTYNLSVESVRKVNVKDPATVMSAAIDFLLLYSLPAAIGTAMKFALTGDDDEDEFWHRMALDQVSYFLAVMVGLREFGAVVSGFSGYSGPAGTRFFNEAAKLATQIGQGDMDAAMLKALNNVGGILFHYPAGQINKTVQGASALLDDETDNPAALLFGHQK